MADRHWKSAADWRSAMDDDAGSLPQRISTLLKESRHRDQAIAAFLDFYDDAALAAAESLVDKQRRGLPLGRLAGVPIAIKDNLCVQGQRTTCASRMLEQFQPVYNAHVIERLLGEDAILLGRTNLDEFAMGSTCENSSFQQTRNPWNRECSPGGSSGGSAAAVAAGLAPLALGSDTGGSIRQPAGFCGVVGVKPTYGRVSRYGLVAFASSLDQIGPFARSVDDAALLLEIVAGHDKRDSTSVDAPLTNLTDAVRQPLEGLTIGIAPEHFTGGVDEDIVSALETALDVYRSLGAHVRTVELPHTRYGVAAYYVIAPSEASSNLARYDGVHYGRRSEDYGSLSEMYENTRGDGFGDECKRRIMIGTYALSSGYYDAYYLKALKVRRLISQDYQSAFEDVDVLLTPISPTPAFRLGELEDDPLRMYLNDVYTIGANLAGIPGISVPCGFTSSGLPVGMQLLAAPFAEEKLLRAARMFEQATDWHRQHPPEPVAPV